MVLDVNTRVVRVVYCKVESVVATKFAVQLGQSLVRTLVTTINTICKIDIRPPYSHSNNSSIIVYLSYMCRNHVTGALEGVRV